MRCPLVQVAGVLGRSFGSRLRLSQPSQFGMTSGSGFFPACERVNRRLRPPAMRPNIPPIATRMNGAAPGLHLVRDRWRGVSHVLQYALSPRRREG
jgi:hypothetical protein